MAQRIGQTLNAWPRWRGAAWGSVLVCGLLAVVVWLAGGAHIQDDVRQLQNGDAALIAQQRQVGDMLGLPSPAQFYLVQGRDAEQLLQREEALKSHLDKLVPQHWLTGYTAVSDWVPSVQRQAQDAALVRSVQAEVLQGINAQLGESFALPESAELVDRQSAARYFLRGGNTTRQLFGVSIPWQVFYSDYEGRGHYPGDCACCQYIAR